MTAPTMSPPASIVPLRPYQQQAHDDVWAAYAEGCRRQLVSIATGGGKTFVAAHLIRTARARGFGQAVFMVHRDELVTQSVRALDAVNPNMTVGVCKAEQDQLGADIIVASAQTLARGPRLERLTRQVVGPVLFVSDEAHHDMAPSRQRAISQVAPELLVGLTATPNRGDKVGLDGIYDRIVFHLPILELIAMNRLSHLVGLRIDTETELDAVHTRAGELAEDELETAVDTPERNRLIVQSWQKHAADRKKTVAFCVTVKHAENLIAAFRDAGIRAEGVFGHTEQAQRAETLKAFSRGEIPVLCNVMVLSEGYDEPGIDCVLWCRPTKSQALYVQCIGRAARKSDEKANALVIDFVDATTRHNLITFPSLTGEEDEVKDHGAGGSAMRQGELLDLLEYAQTSRKLRERAAVAVNLFGASPYIWHTVDGYHMASAGKGGWLALVEAPDGFVPYALRDGTPTEPASMQPLFDRAMEMEAAMSIAEGRIDMNALTARDAGWRQRAEPPTEAQVRYARRLRIPVPQGTTKAELSALIDERAFARAMRAAQQQPRREETVIG